MDFCKAVIELFTDWSIQSIGMVFELIALFVLFYYVCKVLKENNAVKLTVIYVAIILFVGGWAFFLPKGLNAALIFLSIVLLLSLFMLLLFSIEIKRSIWNKKKVQSAVSTNVVKTTSDASPKAEECIESIIRACQNMSKNDVGALIVLSNGNLPKQILESGTIINADISKQIIEGIFFPKAPLHDGALIVQDHKLLAAGCFLPLTQNNEKYAKELGTRHRAGIGITEVANVTSIIVSEETGIISIVKQGKLVQYADYNMLRKELQEYYWKDFATDEHKKKNRVSIR